MEGKLTRNLSFWIAERMNRYTRKEGTSLTKMTIGIEIVLINIIKLTIIYTLAGALGILPQTLAIQVSFAMLKRFSFGLHSLSSTVCTLVSCFLFVLIPWAASTFGIGIGNPGTAVIFVGIILALYLYAPADTKARPLVGAKTRAKLKRLAVIYGAILMISALLMPNETIKLLITAGAAIQAISILPVTYKLLKRTERNYEKYEFKQTQI